MLRRVAAALCGLALVLGSEGWASAQPLPAPCASVHEHARDTVVVFQPPSTFTICRDGAVESDVVTGRPVYLQLTSGPGSRMFDFRVHGQSREWTPTGLGTWQEQTTRLGEALRDLEHAGQPISELVVPGEGAAAPSVPLRPLAASRARYVGEVTPRLLDALHRARGDAHELPVVASVARRWCTELSAEALVSPSLGASLRARCAGPELREGALDHEVEAFENAAAAFGKERDRARDATVTALSRPEDSSAVAEATRALDGARRAASSTIAAGRTLRESTGALTRDLAELRAAVRSLDALRSDTPAYLATYTESGNAELQIDVAPVDIAAAGQATADKESGKTTARFPVVGRHYFDVEVGLGVTGGLPDLPYVQSVSNVATIQSKPVDEFVGLAMVELEPARFLWPDRPLAGLVRLPVLAVPFTRNPTQNFFVGAGLGWTGVGSIVAGPY